MRNVLIIVLVLANNMLFSQNKEKFHVSGGFGNAYMSIYNHMGTSVGIGGEGAMVFSNNFYLGGFGMGTSALSQAKSEISGFEEYHVENEYGGIWVGYLWRIKPFLYLNFSGKFGGGELLLNDRTNHVTTYDPVLVLKPQLAIDFKFLKVLGIMAGVGYNHFVGVSLEGTGAGKYNGLEFHFGVRMGWW